MKVVAFNGSPHKEGNTFLAIQMVAKELVKQGIEVKIVQVGKKRSVVVLPATGAGNTINIRVFLMMIRSMIGSDR